MLRTLGRDIAVYGAADFAFRFIGFAVFPIYAHVFSVEQFGIYALVSTTAGLVALCANLGLNNAAQRFYWDPHTDAAAQSKIVSTGLISLLAWSCVVVLVLATALYPARDLIASRYGISWKLAWIALLTVVPEQVLQFCLGVLRLHFAPWSFALVAFLKNLLGVTVGLILILAFDGGLEGLFLGGLAGAAAAVPVALILIRRDLVIGFNRDLAQRLLAFGYPFVFSGIAYWLFGSVDRWMLAEMSDQVQLGLYAIAYKFAAIVLFLNGAFGQAWSPTALKLRRDDERYRSTYARIFSSWFFFLVVSGSALALFGPEALRLLTPPEYWTAAPVLGILVMGIVISGTTQITAVGISIERKTRLFVAGTWTTALANIVLNYLLIPAWGAIGAAIATLASYGLLTTLYLFWSQKLHPIPIETRKLLYSAALAISMVVLSAAMARLEISVFAILGKIVLLALMIAGGFSLGIISGSVVKTVPEGRLQP